ncbi:hypothetical protein MMC14_000764 [Varicellaria rhodocarpa]|nr:hypothetical protein [Varicellaria rhodocarpa]
MPSTTHSAPEMRRGHDDHIRTDAQMTSRANTTMIPRTSWSASSSSTSYSAEKPISGAASGNAMQRWLDQDPKEEPWYYGGRLTGDTAKDGNVKMKK